MSLNLTSWNQLRLCSVDLSEPTELSSRTLFLSDLPLLAHSRLSLDEAFQRILFMQARALVLPPNEVGLGLPAEIVRVVGDFWLR